MTVPMPLTSAVTELYQDACGGSSMENGTTVSQFARRQHDFPQAWGTQATLCGRKESSQVDGHERATFHHPMMSRFLVAQGSSLHDHTQRVSFTPEIQGVSTAQPMSHSVIRWACDLAVVCGVSLRHSARLFSVRCLMAMPTSSIKRWIDAMGTPLPPPEERRRQRLARVPVTPCHRDGSSPLGTAHGVMVVREEHDRLLMPHAAASEKGEDARPFLQQGKDHGRKGTAAFSDDSQSVTAASKAVFPQARLPADHCHTVKPSWGHLKKALRSSRRQLKAHGAANNDAQVMERAKIFWKCRWSLLKKPAHVSGEETPALAELAREDAGFVQSCRPLIRPLVQSFDQTHSEAQARSRLQQLRPHSNALEDRPLEKMLTFFDDHWEQALRYLRNKGMGKHRRGSNSASGMRLLRRLEKNHDGIRSATTRQHDMQIYQAMPYLSLDIAEFIEKGPQMTGPPHV